MKSRIIVGLLYISIAFAFAGPLLTAFYTEDDFNHLLATIDSSEFHGRDGWYNYIPLTGAIWRICWLFGYNESAVALRIAVGLLLAACAGMLHSFVLTVSNKPRWAALSGLLFLIHPALFEPVVRLSCMHYVLGLTLQLIALCAGFKYMTTVDARQLAVYLGSAVLSILASLHSISVIPLTAVLYLTLILSGQTFKRQTLCVVVTSLIALSALTILIILKIGAFTQSPKSSTLGQSVVEHSWLIFYLFTWHVPFGSSWYPALCALRISGIPVIPILICLAPFVAYAALVLFNRETKRTSSMLTAFSVAALVVTILIPPKPYAMSRYMYYAGPWVSIILAYICDRFLDSRRSTYRLLAIALLLTMCCSSAVWYWHQIDDQRYVSRTSASFVRKALSTPMITSVCVDNMPRIAGDDLPFPRTTFYWIKQAFIAVTPPIAANSKITHLALKFSSNPNLEIWPDTESYWATNETLFICWHDNQFDEMNREQTAAHLRLLRGGSTEGEP